MYILVADDHALVREGLISILAKWEEEISIVESVDACSVLEAVQSDARLDIVLLDLFMPGADGFKLLQSVCNQRPDTPVVVLSASEDPINMRKALDFGAAGYIPKSSASEVMLLALRLIIAGGIYVPPNMLHKPVATANDQASDTGSYSALSLPASYSADLTSRQSEVFRLLGEGKSNKEIARELDLSENTVKIHVRAVLKALGVNNRTKAAMMARELDCTKED